MKLSRSIIVLMLLALMTIVSLNCGGSSAVKGDGDVPIWFLNTPQDPNYLFAASTATSNDLQLAIDKAVTNARAEIGRQTDVKIKALQKRFDEEVGIGENAELLQQFTAATKTVVSTSLSGSQIKEQKYIKEGTQYRSYVLVQYPIGAANEALMQQIQKSNQMYTRFRASETFKELEDEVKKYEEFKKQQGMR